MPSQSTGTLAPSLDSSAETARRLRNRGLANILRMGHCAPSIMQAMLDVSETDAQWLVKLTAGLPGGIGNTGGECGGVTAPLVLLGLRYGQEKPVQGLPVVVHKGHDHLRRFVDSQGTTACREILGNARVPVRCIGVTRQAPVLCAETIGADCTAQSPLRRGKRSAASTPTGSSRSSTPRALFIAWRTQFSSARRSSMAVPGHGWDTLHRDDHTLHQRRHGARLDVRPDREKLSSWYCA